MKLRSNTYISSDDNNNNYKSNYLNNCNCNGAFMVTYCRLMIRESF